MKTKEVIYGRYVERLISAIEGRRFVSMSLPEKNMVMNKGLINAMRVRAAA